MKPITVSEVQIQQYVTRSLIGVLRGNQGRSAGATTWEEGGMPAGDGTRLLSAE